MSTLTTAVQARVATQRLVELTNKNSRSATTVDAAVLALAETDTTAEFATYSGETYDSTIAQHVRICTMGMIAMLRSWAGQDGSETALQQFRDDSERYAKTRNRARILPVTDRDLGPTTDLEADGTPRRPEFDRTRFERLDVAPPRDRSAQDDS